MNSFVEWYRKYRGKVEFFLPVGMLVFGVTYCIIMKKTLWYTVMANLGVFAIVAIVFLMFEVIIKQEEYQY